MRRIKVFAFVVHHISADGVSMAPMARDLVTALPEVNNGMITVPPGPGLGLELHPNLDRRFTTSRRRSDATTI